MKKTTRIMTLIVVAALAGTLGVSSARTNARTLSLSPVDTEPQAGRSMPTKQEIEGLGLAVAAVPDNRRAHFNLVHGLMRAKQFEEALVAARAWREKDAYNLVVVRLMGDIYSELGRSAEALRTYSAVVELLPKDPSAQRALAGVLKQSGNLQAAYDRLATAAALRPDDLRLAFELADAAHRLGRLDEAEKQFRDIASDEEAPSAIRYPAKQRLGQILSAKRRGALADSDSERAKSLAAAIEKLEIKGGTVNDIKIYLTWDTDRSDVDLWVTNPAKEKIFYSHKKGQFGGALFNDVTTGYGPESFTAHKAHRGTYLVQVNYFNEGRGNFSEARGEVVVVLNEGSASEAKHVLPYRLFEEKQTVTVARITVR